MKGAASRIQFHQSLLHLISETFSLRSKTNDGRRIVKEMRADKRDLASSQNAHGSKSYFEMSWMIRASKNPDMTLYSNWSMIVKRSIDWIERRTLCLKVLVMLLNGQQDICTFSIKFGLPSVEREAAPVKLGLGIHNSLS